MDTAALDRLHERADALAGAWGARARASTTLGQERAMLRLFGITGLDRAGRPLAGAAVDRWAAGPPGTLGGGIALSFAMALLEYDVEPQQLALDVSSGAVDLALEAELLREPDRRAVAEAEATRLVGLALDRIDADRVARRELISLLGEARQPWIGTTLTQVGLGGALDEAAALGSAGFDVLRVEVPIGRELAARLHDAGMEPPEWQPPDGGAGTGAAGAAAAPGFDDGDLAPTGSQRALARLRLVADGVAAERRGYVRIATAVPPLGVPEGAIVAAFERVDIIEADPMAEIVVGGVSPDRALADHAFARRLHRRADTYVSIGPGPLVVAPDLASGVPADVATRSGRALALQLIGVALARRDGMAEDRLLVGAHPTWLADETFASARIAAEVTLRGRLFEGMALRFDEPAAPEVGPEALTAWPFVTGAALGLTDMDAVVVRHQTVGVDAVRAAGDMRAAASVGRELAEVSARGPLEGRAADHADAVVAATLATLDRLADRGWHAVVGEAPADARTLGGEAVAERTEAFDPLAALEG